MTNYKCKDCGNNEHFNVQGTEDVSLVECYDTSFSIDNEGEIQDSEQSDCNDSWDHEIVSSEQDWSTLECGECGSDNVVDIDDEPEELTWKSRINKPKAL